MPRPKHLSCWLLGAVLVLPSCRPGDAPKEPTEPAEPTVSTLPAPAKGGVGMAFARRGQLVTRL